MKNNHGYLAKMCQEAYKISKNSKGFYWFNIDNIIVISGTDHWKDWIDNLNCLPCSVEGYHKSYYKYASEIVSEINKNKNKEYLFVGHSAGGGIAEICALLSDNSSVSFGAPKIYFRSGFSKSKRIRYELKFDPVTWLSCRPNSVPGSKTITLPGCGHDINLYIERLV